MREFVWVLICFFLCCSWEADAGPLKRFRQRFQPTCQSVTGPSAECKREEALAPQPSSPISVQDDSYSLQPDTVLVPEPGTGLPSPTGPLQPLPPPKEVPPATLPPLKELLPKLGHLQVGIAPAMTGETSQQWSRVLTGLEWLLYVGLGLGGTSLAGKFGPLVALAGRGLLSASQAGLQAAAKTAVGGSQLPTSQSSAVNPVAVSSTSQPAS